jgi:hypothetical protein
MNTDLCEIDCMMWLKIQFIAGLLLLWCWTFRISNSCSFLNSWAPRSCFLPSSKCYLVREFLLIFSASLTVSGSFELSVSGKVRDKSPERIDMPPKRNRGRDSRYRSCKEDRQNTHSICRRCSVLICNLRFLSRFSAFEVIRLVTKFT